MTVTNKRTATIERYTTLGKSKIDMDLKRFLIIAGGQNKSRGKNSELIRNVLLSFVLDIKYDFEDNKDIVAPEERQVFILSLSELRSTILYNWYNKYVLNKVNESGIIKQIVHYHLFRDILAINIDVEKFHDKRENDGHIVNEEIIPRTEEVIKKVSENKNNKTVNQTNQKLPNEIKSRLNNILSNVGE